MLNDAAKLLHEKNLYPAVAHSAYYSCYQLLKHIWLYSMRKSQKELDASISMSKMGSHEYLINQTVSYIESLGSRDCKDHARNIGNKITQLKRLRTNADYHDDVFDISKSSNSISLSDDLIPILKKY